MAAMPDAAAGTRKQRENRTRWVVLGMLTYGPMNGYALRRLIGETVGHFWQESYGQLYPTLRGLVSERLVGASAVAARAVRRGPGRRATTYHLTRRGRAALSAWVALPPAKQPTRNELLLKLFFAGAVPPEVTARNLERVAAGVRAQRVQLEGIAAGVSAKPPCHPDAPYWRLTLEFGLDVTRATLDWLERALGVLRARARGSEAAAGRASATRQTRRSR